MGTTIGVTKGDTRSLDHNCRKPIRTLHNLHIFPHIIPEAEGFRCLFEVCGRIFVGKPKVPAQGLEPLTLSLNPRNPKP